MEKDYLVINIISIANSKKHKFVFFVSYEKTRNADWKYTWDDSGKAFDKANLKNKFLIIIALIILNILNILNYII